MIVAPHADDETLGCGGTILKLIAQGHEVHWLLVTGMSASSGFSKQQIDSRKNEIYRAAKVYGFAKVHELMLPPARLDTLALGQIIDPLCQIITEVKPEQVFTAYRNDAHSDHQIVYDAVMSATKSFRYPFVKKVLAYETMSETNFGLKPEDGGFKPNVFIDIGLYLQKKLEILSIFSSELGEFPFPRSIKALEALAHIRGAQCNAEAAEAFMLIKEVS
ncbi:GlcNAc-PI de-N-acetylase [Rheinheimera tangshanensis]|nr:GlcNAc-PI de-N-acetylase [Rheinheimera tangshanensis]